MTMINPNLPARTLATSYKGTKEQVGSLCCELQGLSWGRRGPEFTKPRPVSPGAETQHSCADSGGSGLLGCQVTRSFTTPPSPSLPKLPDALSLDSHHTPREKGQRRKAGLKSEATSIWKTNKNLRRHIVFSDITSNFKKVQVSLLKQ